MELLSLPEQTGTEVRAQLGLSEDAELRLSFLAGNGDVVGTWRHWQAGEHDPRVPVVTYSAMFYDLVHSLSAQAQVISPFAAPDQDSAPFRFDTVTRPPWSGRFGYWRSTAAYGRALTQAVARFDPHVVLVHSDSPASVWAGLRQGKRRVVLSAHNTYWPMNRPPTGWKSRLKLGLLRRQARALDGAVCTSAECLRQVRQLTRADLPGAVQTPQMLRRFEVQQHSRARRLLYLGRVETSKGVFDLLEAFTALTLRHTDLSLRFAGQGRAADRLAARISETPGDVAYLGQLDATGVHQAIANADLVICPTTTAFDEGLAMVTLEAAAHGIPSVLSDVVPALDLLGPACAVYPADDTPALTSCLEGLISDDAAYQRLCAATRAPREGLLDRSRSWGSELGALLQRL